VSLFRDRGIAEGDLRRLSVSHKTAQLIVGLIKGSASYSMLAGIPMRKVLSNVKDFVSAAVLADTSNVSTCGTDLRI
jgi:hypothetical protein